MCQHSYSRILKKYINLKYLLTYAESGKKGVDTAIDYEITKIETGRGGWIDNKTTANAIPISSFFLCLSSLLSLSLFVSV
jgi:hypothetical protein